MRWLLLLTISLAGCAGHKPPPFVPAKVALETIVVYADCGTPPQRSAVEFRTIRWQVLPDARGEQRFTLTAQGYADLGFNQSEIAKGVRELKAEIQYYLNCLSRPIEVPASP